MAIKTDDSCLYTKSHEWVRIEGDTAVSGITDHAQEQLSDIVYVELPEAGDSFAQGAPYGVVESVKAASDCFLPIGGEILERNAALEDSPELVNSAPYTEAWFVRFRVTDASEAESLMSPADYERFVQEEAARGGH